jgi:hypothetical protein
MWVDISNLQYSSTDDPFWGQSSKPIDSSDFPLQLRININSLLDRCAREIEISGESFGTITTDLAKVILAFKYNVEK